MAEYDMEEAIERAHKFLEEHHNTIDLKSADLDGDVWRIIFDVGFLSQQLKEVKVHSQTGKILGYSDIEVAEE
jgi:uncharacterized membrane protein YkoI